VLPRRANALNVDLGAANWTLAGYPQRSGMASGSQRGITMTPIGADTALKLSTLMGFISERGALPLKGSRLKLGRAPAQKAL
jgi:hypothetical protein